MLHQPAGMVLFLSIASGLLSRADLAPGSLPELLIPAEFAVPAANVDLDAVGFRVRTWSVDAWALPQNNERTEQELDGEWGPNLADPSIFDRDGYYWEPGVINYLDLGASGNFEDDATFPGVTGEAFVLEAIAFIEFPTAGVYRMGVNCDDSFRVSTGRDFRDRFEKGVILADVSQPGGRAQADVIFSFRIQSAGIYPFRLTYAEGLGDSACEWFSVLDDGTKILINDRADPRALKAWSNGPWHGPAFVKSVRPGANIYTDYNALADLSVVLQDADTKVIDQSVNLQLDGVVVKPLVTRSDTLVTVTYKPTAPPAAGSHQVALSYEHTSSPVSSRQLSFEFTFKLSPADLPTNSFWIEAEDFDFGGGQARPEASRMPYPGGAYEGLGALKNIDFFNQEGHLPGYRKSADPDRNDFDIYGFIGGRWNLQRPGGVELSNNYIQGWADTNDWFNYTRDIPDAFYRIYAALSFEGMDAGQLRGALDKVTNGLGTPTQTLEHLGDFDAPGSGNYGDDDLVPMHLPSGEEAIIHLSGTTTLRFRQNGADFDYLVLAPVTNAPAMKPPILHLARDGRNVALTFDGKLFKATAVTGPFVEVPGAVSPFQVTGASGDQAFWRAGK